MVNQKELKKLFYPKSIAVVGASDNLKKIGGFIFSELKKYQQRDKSVSIFPINLGKKKIQGFIAYDSLLSIKGVRGGLDLVIISVPKDYVISTIEEAGKSQVKNVVIITAGFKETGLEGMKLEKQITSVAKKYRLNIIGPNCLGILNPEIKLNCSFAKDIPNSGNIAFISQSGAVIDGIIDWSFSRGIGFSKIVSIGNMADVSIIDLLKYLKEDSQTETILLYMETIPDGKVFSRLVRSISKVKPVIILKPGNSKSAKKAISSHTGSLAKDGTLIKRLIEDSNGIYITSFKELFSLLEFFKCSKRSSSSKRLTKEVIVLTNAGGPGVIATDHIDKTGLELYALEADVKEKLYKKLPSAVSLNNPIDILGDATSERYNFALKTLFEETDVDNYLILLTPQIMTDTKKISQVIVNLNQKFHKNIFVSYIGEKEIVDGKEVLIKNRIPFYDTPEEAIYTMNKVYNYQNFEYKNRLKDYGLDKVVIQKVESELKRLKSEDYKGVLSNKIVKRVLHSIKIKPFTKIVLQKREDLKKSSVQSKLGDSKINYVLKVEHKSILHKKELGAVLTSVSLKSIPKLVNELFDKFEKDYPKLKVTIEKEVLGLELFLGYKNDEILGSFLFFGTGGIYANVYNDISLAKAPLNETASLKLIESTKVVKILKGYRDTKKVDLNKLSELLVKVSLVAKYFPEIKEIDFNPVICDGNKIYLVDVKMII